jgi:subtilisin family serine protease
MLIAVLDAGFVGANSITISDQLKTTTTRNFVEGGTNVYQGSSHGFSVLSTMASYQPEVLIGTAPQASYALIKTEKELSETPEEMFNWIAGAEFADSIGADIINSSLGYSTFDDPADDYTVADLDGRTSIISLGAVAAARTGMLVVTSAGNAGGSSWDKITFPADADSILTVGSVTQYGMASNFSSRGYTVDGRVKPNVSARGEGAVVYRSDGTLAYANGTSFSSPIVAGAAACLWSTVPNATAQEVIKALEISASHYYQHNPRIGYGIPNLDFARQYLSAVVDGELPEIVVYPNPFPDYITLFLPDGESLPIYLELRDLYQRTVATATLESKRYKALWAPGATIAAGTYFLYIERGGRMQVLRVTKLL